MPLVLGGRGRRRDRGARGAAARSGAPIAIVSAAHTERMLRMPEYKSAYRRALPSSAPCSCWSWCHSARSPWSPHVRSRPMWRTRICVNRDIVLCLDVSGSMTAADAAIVQRFLELVEQFHGERIALVVWDSSAAQVFPLNDDYDYVEEQLASIADETSSDVGDVGDIFGGDPDVNFLRCGRARPSATGCRSIGDGLASCVLRLRQPRPRPLAHHHPGDRQSARGHSDRDPGGGNLVLDRT